MKVYLDNAATTQLDPQVIEVMTSVMKNEFGNPSSIHSYGRQTRSIVERARKNVAKHLNWHLEKSFSLREVLSRIILLFDVE